VERVLKGTDVPRVSAAARSDVGNVREHNEDAFVCLPRRGRFAVIDGMGGQAAGEVASGVARKHLAGTTPLRAAILAANDEIRDRGERLDDEKGMGCVLTSVNTYEAELEVGHVGDTRLYLATLKGCLQVTRDHTLRAEVQEAKGLTDADAAKIRRGNQVTRDVGGRADLPELIERHVVDWGPGDLLLMSSDGLHDLVKGPELSKILASARDENTDVNDVVEQLVGLALERGAHDNVTVIAVRHEGKARVFSRATLKQFLIVMIATLVGFAAGSQLTPSGDSAGEGASVGLDLHPAAEIGQDAEGNTRLFEAGFDFPDLLERSGHFVATGPWSAVGEGETVATSTEAEVEVRLTGAEISFGPDVTRWRILLGENASLTLRNFVVDAPQVRIDVVPFSADSRLVLQEGRWNVASVEVEGVPVHPGTTAVQLDRVSGLQLAESPPDEEPAAPESPAAGSPDGEEPDAPVEEAP
jgi:protein phosphatase